MLRHYDYFACHRCIVCLPAGTPPLLDDKCRVKAQFSQSCLNELVHRHARKYLHISSWIEPVSLGDIIFASGHSHIINERDACCKFRTNFQEVPRSSFVRVAQGTSSKVTLTFLWLIALKCATNAPVMIFLRSNTLSKRY